ncbi:MAG: SusC/RagA family TonB-linked outer membrane protein [Prevotella sp.]|nr:SusC/RagA family TonB-linked outer membrane protein [Prevotella sp.]
MKKRIAKIYFSFLISHFSFSAAQAQMIKGTVVDDATGEPFAGARITVVDNTCCGESRLSNSKMTMSKENGLFTLTVPNADAILRIEAPGYDMQLWPLRGSLDKILVRMLPSGKAEPAYDEYSLQARSIANTPNHQTTNTPNHLTADENVSMLAGHLRSITHSGLDGGGHAFFIRGLHSLNMQSQPLIIVDGQQLTPNSQHPTANTQHLTPNTLLEGYFGNPLALISPDDIERIEVLKNGTAIWGAKAANGVIVITTKRSHNMATEIEVNLSAGIHSQGKAIPMLGASDYRVLASDLLSTDTQHPSPRSAQRDACGTKRSKNTQQLRFLNDDPSTSFYKASHNDTDWQDVISHTATTQNYGIAVRGGDDVALYSFSLGYAHNDGIIRETNFDRLNVRFNSDIDLTKHLKTRADIAFAQVSRNLMPQQLFGDDGSDGAALNSQYLTAYLKSPLYSPHQFDTQGRLFGRLSDVDELGVANPLAIVENAEGKTKNYCFTASLAPVYTFSEHFSLKAMAAYSWDKTKESSFMPDYGLPEVELLNAQGDWYGTAQNSVASLMTRHSTLTLDLSGELSKLCLESSQSAYVSVIAGFRYLNDTFQSDYGQGYNTGSDNLRSLSVTTSSLRTTNGVNDDWRSLSWYAQADFSLRNRYLLSASATLETNSRFGKEASGMKLGGVVWGVFPSVNAAWIVSNEHFMQRLRAINYLKLHVGYDLAGNDGLPVSVTRTYFETTPFAGLAKGLVLANVGNEKLKWERTATLTAGIDMRMLHNRLSLSADYFRSTTKDLLVRKQLNREYGLESYWTNDGELQNEGFEAALSARLIDKRDWQLNARLSVGHYKNKVKHLTDGDFVTQVLGANVLTSEGRPLGVFYGYRSLGVFTDQAEAEQANLAIIDETGRRQPFAAGDIHFADRTADGIIDEHDMDVIGDPNPDVYGSFGFNLTWRRLTLDAFFTYSLGNDAFNALRQQLENGSTLANQSQTLRRRWMTDGQQTDVPKATFGDPMGNSRFSDRWIEDASYLKLRQVSLTYDLPIRPRIIQGMQVWASVENIFTVTHYLGADPEFSYGTAVISQGIDAGLLPQSRSYHVGVKLNL